MRRLLLTALKWTVIAVMAALLLIVCWQVVSRYLLASPSTVSEELARILLMWLGMFGAAYTAGEKGHIAIDLISERFSPEGRRHLQRWIAGIGAVFALALFAGGARMIYDVWDLRQVTPVLGWPQSLVYLPLPLSAVFLLVFLVEECMFPTPESMEKTATVEAPDRVT